MKSYSSNVYGLDEYLQDVLRHVLKKSPSYDVAWATTDPLRWYINTGRASVSFCQALVQKSPYRIAQKLLKGGSYQEAVDRIREYLGFPKAA